MATAMTLGYGGFVGLIGMAIVAWFADVTPKAPSWMATPQTNTPDGSPPEAMVPEAVPSEVNSPAVLLTPSVIPTPSPSSEVISDGNTR